MSIDYSFELALGFRVTREEVEKLFGQKLPEKSHTEPRYDSKTGERLDDVQVLDDEAELQLIWNSVEYDSCEELLDTVFGTIGVEVHLGGSQLSDEEHYIIGPGLATTGDREDIDSHITLGADVIPSDMLAAISVLPSIERFMKRLGFDTSEGPTITICSYIC